MQTDAYKQLLADLRAKAQAAKQPPAPISEALQRLEQLKQQAATRNETHAALSNPGKKSLADILAEQQRAVVKAESEKVVHVPSVNDFKKSILSDVVSMIWNAGQSLAINYGQQGKSFVLIGAAGTGKTTTLKGILQTLLANHQLPPLTSSSKMLTVGMPGIVLVAYTRRAVRQIARQMPKELKHHCMTIHRLLEFEPVFYEYDDPETGKIKKTMRFEPMRNGLNPLPNISCVVFDESSMTAVDLYEQVESALPRNCQKIFLGDLHQLPPVYGDSILAQKLQELPVVELTEVYRQALDSPIIRLATDVKDGKEIPFDGKKVKWSSPDGKSNVTINSWGKQLGNEDASDAFAATIKKLIENRLFNEEEDVILMPHHKPGSVGCHDLNLQIANALAVQRGAVVHHIRAGYVEHYLAVGDRLLVDKQDCIIREIIPNPKYVGKSCMEPAVSLDRWGTYQDNASHSYMESDEDIDAMFERMSNAAMMEEGDKVNEASHVLVLESLDSGLEWRVSQIGTFNSMVFSYALTVHKSQGSEWRRVFLFLHTSHHAMCSRELVYTAVTRAREDLVIICEPDRRAAAGTLTKAAKSPRIKGNTLAEKLQWLKERAAAREQEELV